MQASVKDFLDKHSLYSGVETRYIDLTTEVGELGKEILKGGEYGQKAYENTPSA